MTENPNAFKLWFDEPLVRRIAGRIAATGPFDEATFVAECMAKLDALELKDRVRLITEALRRHLPDDYPTAAGRILAALPVAKQTTDDVSDGFDIWPYCHFVQEYGQDHLEVSMNAMFELTQRFSSEFAVRPYLMRYQEEVLAQLLAWTKHQNPHVRRWVSEGTRPRLPWGVRLQAFVDDPTPILPLLEALRHDDEEYVRRSVANNLNDIAKDHPDLVVEIAERWWPDSDHDERRMIRHALRTLVKRGHNGALAVLGYGPAAVEIEQFTVAPGTAVIGESVQLSLKLRSPVEDTQALLIDYAVHHVRANGTTGPKVFKWTKRQLKSNAGLELTKKHSLKVITTRRYYPGTHVVELLINGASVAETEFELQS
jgi:3-methyladenine DNA glycosylase AlkC